MNKIFLQRKSVLYLCIADFLFLKFFVIFLSKIFCHIVYYSVLFAHCFIGFLFKILMIILIIFEMLSHIDYCNRLVYIIFVKIYECILYNEYK